MNTMAPVAFFVLIAAALFILVVLGGLVAMIVHKPTRVAGIAIAAFLGLLVVSVLGFGFLRASGGPAHVSSSRTIITEGGVEQSWPLETQYIPDHSYTQHSQSQNVFNGKIVVSSWAKLFVTILLAAIVGLLTGGERVRSVAVRMLGVTALLIGGLGVLYFFTSTRDYAEIAAISPPMRVQTEALPPVAPVPPVPAEHTVRPANPVEGLTTAPTETVPASSTPDGSVPPAATSPTPTGETPTPTPAAGDAPQSQAAEATPNTADSATTNTASPPSGSENQVPPAADVAPSESAATSTPVTAAPDPGKTTAPEATPSPVADTTKPTPTETPAARPDWIDKPSQRVGSEYLTHVKSGLFSTFEECERALAIASRNAVREYAIDYLGTEENVHQIQLTPQFLAKLQRGPDYQEQVDASVGPMVQLHRQLVIDDAARNELRSMWENVIRGHRLWYLGSGALLVLSMIGTLFSYLKLDLITGGSYRGRLQLAATSAILVATAAAIIVRKW